MPRVVPLADNVLTSYFHSRTACGDFVMDQADYAYSFKHFAPLLIDPQE